MEHTTENQTENKIETEQTIENMQESRSVYQKRKRDAEKQIKRKTRKKALLIIFVLVVLSGILCGAVIASNINAQGDTIEIASANAQYVVSTLKSTVKDKLSDFSILLHNLPSLGDASDTKPNDDAVDVPPNPDGDTDTETEFETGTGTESQTTTESTVSLVTSDNPYGIDPSKPMVALTFDDGPSKYTWSIVSALAQYNARATFFLVGNRVASHEAAIDFVLENHNEVASHSFSHANLAKITEEEVLSQIQKVDTALQMQHDYTPALFRVPYGERDERVLQIMREQNKPVIGWSVDPRDWEVQDKDAVVQHVLSHVKDGDIILMHDLYKPTADAVAELIPALQERGYQLVTVSELFHYKGLELIPGTYYYASWKWV